MEVPFTIVLAILAIGPLWARNWVWFGWLTLAALLSPVLAITAFLNGWVSPGSWAISIWIFGLAPLTAASVLGRLASLCCEKFAGWPRKWAFPVEFLPFIVGATIFFG